MAASAAATKTRTRRGVICAAAPETPLDRPLNPSPPDVSSSTGLGKCPLPYLPSMALLSTTTPESSGLHSGPTSAVSSTYGPMPLASPLFHPLLPFTLYSSATAAAAAESLGFSLSGKLLSSSPLSSVFNNTTGRLYEQLYSYYHPSYPYLYHPAATVHSVSSENPSASSSSAFL